MPCWERRAHVPYGGGRRPRKLLSQIKKMWSFKKIRKKNWRRWWWWWVPFHQSWVLKKDQIGFPPSTTLTNPGFLGCSETLMMMMMTTEVPNHIGPLGILKLRIVSVCFKWRWPTVGGWVPSQGVSLFTGISSIYRLEAQQNLQKTAIQRRLSENSATKSYLCVDMVHIIIFDRYR